jgi:hypothetical protein
MVNTCAFQLTDLTDPVIQHFLDTVSTTWSAQVHTNHTNVITYTHASAIYNDPILGLTAMDTVTGAGVGGRGTTPMMPLSVALVIQKTTAFAGRKFRGRMFFGGFPTSWIGGTNPNEIQASLVTSTQLQWDAFRNAVIATGAVPVLLHQVGGPTPTLITKFEVHPLVATLRKRIR